MYKETLDGIVCVKKCLTKKDANLYTTLFILKSPCLQQVVKIENGYAFEEAMDYEEYLPTAADAERLYKIFEFIKIHKIPCRIGKVYICDGVLKAYVLPYEEYNEKDLCEEYARLLGIRKPFYYIENVKHYATSTSFFKHIPGFRSGKPLNRMLAIFVYVDCFLWALAVSLVFGFNPDEVYFWVFWYIMTLLVPFTVLDFFHIAEKLIKNDMPRGIKVGLVFIIAVTGFVFTYLITGFALL